MHGPLDIRRPAFGLVLTVALVAGFLLTAGFVGRSGLRVSIPITWEIPSLESSGVRHPTFLSPHANPIVVSDGHVFVVNTPADTVDVIDAGTRAVVARINVGIDPVGLAVRPDGKEVWVSNHVSDSVSVIDTDRSSPTNLRVIATVQDLDPVTRATRFDEPVGVAFASSEKAYVALSSENLIAVIDVATRQVVNTLEIRAQDPRAITVRADRLYVIPFESNNQTQLSGGSRPFDGELVTFDAWEHAVANNNVLSVGAVMDIVKHPEVPDRDLFVFDTTTDELVEVVDTLGTLLYGLATDSNGRVFIAQTDARNDSNGRAGTEGHGLAEMENRAFLNQITSVGFRDDAAEPPEFIDLEPLPPEHPEPGSALATPFAIQISDDDTTLVVSAAGSDKIMTIDAETGEVLGRVGVDAAPRGIALESGADGKPARAWVYNAVANSVSLVDLSDRASPTVVGTTALHDPTHPAVKRGRTAFNSAAASTTGTFSCASCHPDGHTDQLLWVLDTPVVTGGDQIMPRSTMPVRGLRDTAPFHWDGIPGDPYGGNNSANVYGSDAPNSSLDDPRSATRHLVDSALATTMSTVREGEPATGALTESERDDLATFLLSVQYPPAPRRAYTNVLSEDAARGFELFHIEGDDDPTKPLPFVCGDCHRMPFLVSTNTPGTGMDAPTWRGAYDRWLILPQGRLNIVGLDFYRRVAERGTPERSVWRFSWAGRPRFDPVWDMVLEASTGFSGAFARQVTLDQETAGDPPTLDLLDALELAAREGAVVLHGDGVLLDDAGATPATFRFDPDSGGGLYNEASARRGPLTRAELVALAADGRFVGTLTARHGTNADVDHPQPALWTLGPIESQSGHQEFPFLYDGKRAMTISGRHIQSGASLIVDGRRVDGILGVDGEMVEIELAQLPVDGTHFLQVQNPDGLFSNEFIFHVTQDEQRAEATRRRLDRERDDPRQTLSDAVAAGHLDWIRRILAEGSSVNAREPQGGSTPLSTAALHGHVHIAEFLIEQGARVSGKNRDGNTPLHVAAFLCEHDVVDLLMEHGASVSTRNDRGESPIDVVSSPWSPELGGFYTEIGNAIGRELDLERIEADRPRVAAKLRAHEDAIQARNNARGAPAGPLADHLRETGWDRIIGTWIDEGTEGAAIETTYTWKIAGSVLEVTSREGDRESVALIGLDQDTGEVFHMGTDSRGARFHGRWTFLENGPALLDLGDPAAGVLRIRLRLESDDTLVVTIDGPEPITVRMTRSDAG